MQANMSVQVMMQVMGDGDVCDTLKRKNEGDENE